MKKKRHSKTVKTSGKSRRQELIDQSAVLPSDGEEISEACPLCGQQTNELQAMDAPIDGVSVKHWRDTLDRIMAEHREWSAEDGACVRCIAYYGMARAGRAGEET
ncbi:MAG: hypothetical protein ACM3OC_04635 [Deltaproteobacteria bacterium]